MAEKIVLKNLYKVFGTNPEAEINKFMKGKLDSERTRELTDAKRKAG